MTTNMKSFVGNHIPDFINSEHPQFRLFLEAYYEWLEQQNTGVSTSSSDLFKVLENPGGLINNAQVNRDIDDTLDGFLNYFQNEVLPITVEAASATQRFTIKKIRDVYLSKGTPKSFKLLFRLLYDREIEIYEPAKNVLEASEGKYLSFPNVYLEVVDINESLDLIDLSLSYLSDSEDGQNVTTTILSGAIVGVEDSDKNQILKAQLNNIPSLDSKKQYFLFDGSDITKFVKVKTLPTISSININKKGTLYTENDKVSFTSTRFKRKYNAEIDSISFSPITHVIFRNRGAFYNKGDMFFFYSDSAFDGKGGYFTVTEVDGAGRITQIDGIDIRTGQLNNGFQSGTFEDVKIKIDNGGRWKVIPKIRYVPANNNGIGKPYNNDQEGFGAQVTPYSDSLGQINAIAFRDIPYFNDSDDISVQIPFNFLLENNDTITKGNIVAFETYLPENGSFTDDSETIVFDISSKRDVEKDFLRFREVTFNLPVDFDSDLFQWGITQYSVDSEFGLSDLVTNYDSDSLLTHTSTYDVDFVFAGPNTFDGAYSDAIVDVDGGASFATAGADLDLGAYDNVPGQTWNLVINKNSFIDKLDRYHFSTLDTYNPTYADSDMQLTFTRKTGNPNKPAALNTGSWIDRNLYGRVIATTDKVVKIVEEPGLPFVTDSELAIIGSEKYGIIRMSPLSASGVVESNQDLRLTNVVLDYSTFSFDYKLDAVTETVKQFVNEDGFLNSTSGGVINDNFLYSTHTYVVKTTLPIKEWRGKVKTLLHPAGKYMFGETVVEQPIDGSSSLAADTTASSISSSSFTFSQSQDYWVDGSGFEQITADQTLYKSNSFERITEVSVNGAGLTADNFTNLAKIAEKTQHGNSFWDYEPIGLGRKEPVDVISVFGALENLENYSLSVSSQDSDTLGYVKNETMFWSQWSGTAQDFYKGSSRREKSYSPPLIKKTLFADTVSEKYTTYDSDLPTDFFMRMSDSDGIFNSIDYGRLRTTGDTTRNLPTFPIPRQKEIAKTRLEDFNAAMKENGALSYTVDGKTLTDFDAYEMKWNTINVNRTDGTQGWVIPGWQSSVQNMSNNISRKRRVSAYGIEDIKYTDLRTPLSPDVWDQAGDDFWTWIPTYNVEINKTEYFNYDIVKQDESETFNRDPNKLMQGRRVK